MLPDDVGGEGRIPGENDGPRARREPIGLLLVALQRLPARRLVGRARGGPARVAGVGPQVRLPVREMLPARRVLRIDPVQVRKLMRELGIRGCTPNARKRTTIPDPKARPRPDLVRRDFTSPVPTCKLVGDITYLRTGEDGCTCRRSSTSTPAWWWAGRSPSA